jgi:hypothetical protein
MSSAPFCLQWQLGRPKLDRAEMLSALVALADENPGVFGALVADAGQRGVLTPSRLGGQGERRAWWRRRRRRG